MCDKFCAQYVEYSPTVIMTNGILTTVRHERCQGYYDETNSPVKPNINKGFQMIYTWPMAINQVLSLIL